MVFKLYVEKKFETPFSQIYIMPLVCAPLWKKHLFKCAV